MTARARRHAAALACAAAAACAPGGEAPARDAAPAADSVAAFDPSRDYFPDKARVRRSTQFAVEYHGHYKVLTVTPRKAPHRRERYALVRRGTPAPPGFDARHVIPVPVRRFVLTHRDYRSSVVLLGVDDRLAGLDRFRTVTLPALRRRIDAGAVQEIGAQEHLDVERVLALAPDVVLNYWSVADAYNVGPKLAELGVRSVGLVAHWEEHPVASAEWLKAVALFFDREAEAERLFDAIEARYERVAAGARAAPARPMVLSGRPGRDAWGVLRPDIYLRREFVDAGGDYFWPVPPDSATFPSVPLEAVLERARDAPVWVRAPDGVRSVDDLVARDARLALFTAVRRGEVYAFDRGRTPAGGNPYDERWVTEPDVVLADMVAVIHPELARGRPLVFARRLDPPAGGAAAP